MSLPLLRLDYLDCSSRGVNLLPVSYAVGLKMGGESKIWL